MPINTPQEHQHAETEQQQRSPNSPDSSWDSLDSPSSPEQTQATPLSDDEKQRLGIKSLVAAGFVDKHKDIVDSALARQTRLGEKYAGKPGERRVSAYLDRLQNLIDKHGSKAEKRLWDLSTKRLLLKEENVSEDYWRARQQELRDNGLGNYQLNAPEKRAHVKDLQRLQRESLEEWTRYLSDEHSPYPLWFKVYVWDGLSKMGNYDSARQAYHKRDAHTVAPFPRLDQAALGKTYEETLKVFEGDKDVDAKLMKAITHGDFANTFLANRAEQYTKVPVPGKPEDVHGNWFEYGPGQEQEIAALAEGTPWCVASPAVAKNYLDYGEYDHEQYFDDEPDTDDQPDNRARFLLFRLNDPQTGGYSDQACASVRLDLQGNVAEISGLKDGQALDDALVPLVESKVLALPGGDAFLPAFKDKQKLIDIDHRFQAGENLTEDDIAFLSGDIHTLDTYNQADPRIEQLRLIALPLARGEDVNKVVSRLTPYFAITSIDILNKHGADINASHLMPQLEEGQIDRCFSTLLKHGVDVNAVTSRLSRKTVFNHLSELLDNNADLDIILSRLNEMDPSALLPIFLRYSEKININDLVSRLSPITIGFNLKDLLKHGANINTDDLVSRLGPDGVELCFDELIKGGVEINIKDLVAKLYEKPGGANLVAIDLEKLNRYGAEINIKDLVAKLYEGPRGARTIAVRLEDLARRGANIKMHELLPRLDRNDILGNLETLLNHGAHCDISYRAKIASSKDIFSDFGYSYDELLDWDEMRYLHDEEYREKVDSNIAESNSISYKDILEHLDTFLDHDANIDVNDLCVLVDSSDIINHLDKLMRRGGNINKITPNLDIIDALANIDKLHHYHVDFDSLISLSDYEDIQNATTKLIDFCENYCEGVYDPSDLSYDERKNIKSITRQFGSTNINDIVKKLHLSPESMERILGAYREPSMHEDENWSPPDIYDIFYMLNPESIITYLQPLVRNGVNIDDVLNRLSQKQIYENLATLLSLGADIDIKIR